MLGCPHMPIPAGPVATSYPPIHAPTPAPRQQQQQQPPQQQQAYGPPQLYGGPQPVAQPSPVYPSAPQAPPAYYSPPPQQQPHKQQPQQQQQQPPGADGLGDSNGRGRSSSPAVSSREWWSNPLKLLDSAVQKVAREVGSSSCAGCGRAGGLGPTLRALGKEWHPGCFR